MRDGRVASLLLCFLEVDTRSLCLIVKFSFSVVALFNCKLDMPSLWSLEGAGSCAMADCSDFWKSTCVRFDLNHWSLVDVTTPY